MSSPMRPPGRVATAVVGLLILAALGAAGPVRADTKEQLDQAKRELSALIGQIGARSQTVQHLQSEAEALAAKISEIQAKIARNQARAEALERQVLKAARALAGLQEQLDQRARAAYVLGPGNDLEILLGSTSLADFSARMEYINRAGRSDGELIAQVEQRRAALERKQAEVAALQRALEADRRELNAQQTALQNKLSAAQAELSAMEQDRAAAEGLVEKLTAQREREIQQARLAAAEAATQSSGSSPSVGGSSPFSVCPVDPPRAVGDDFGAPRWGGGFHRHQGNDIFAPAGTPIRAPFSGNAVNATNSLGGLAVIVHGSQGYVYNAHMVRIGSLGSVGAGTIIGYVGNTGDAQGGAMHDHFEWHPGNGGAIDPHPYLMQVC
jgi:peptidoglycan LD-endopeptidase LytH